MNSLNSKHSREKTYFNKLLNLQAVESLVVMASGFDQEGPGPIPGTVKDPPSTCGVRARKIVGSKSLVVGLLQFTMGIVTGENFPPF